MKPAYEVAFFGAILAVTEVICRKALNLSFLDIIQSPTSQISQWEAYQAQCVLSGTGLTAVAIYAAYFYLKQRAKGREDHDRRVNPSDHL